MLQICSKVTHNSFIRMFLHKTTQLQFNMVYNIPICKILPILQNAKRKGNHYIIKQIKKILKQIIFILID
jgi:hypothetical protein